jgi:hypothetical protein
LKRPRPDTCFRIGEALRSAGVPWSNGGSALLAAGYIAEFVGLLIALSNDSIEGEFIAMILFMVCAIVAMPADGPPDETALLSEARAVLPALFANYGDRVLVAWKTLTRTKLLERRLPPQVEGSLKAALILAQQLPAQDELREIEVTRTLIQWAMLAEFLTHDFASLGKRFTDALQKSVRHRTQAYYHLELRQRSLDCPKPWDGLWARLER